MPDARYPSLSVTRARVVVGVLIVATLILAWQPPLAQPPEYHNFADTRALGGLANAGDVLSNLAFFIVGLAGLRTTLLATTLAARREYVVFFVGVTLTAFGSAYYHHAPDHGRLVWDRLPMTIGFMGLLAATIGERVDLRWGRRALGPLLALGIASVVYWIASENHGAGDLRPYVGVQFVSLVAIVGLLWASPRPDRRSGLLWAGLGCYVAAKFFETFDHAIFQATATLVSGHTLKHLLAAVGVGLVGSMVAATKPASA